MSKSVLNISKDILKLFRDGNEVPLNNISYKFTKTEKLVFLAYSSKIIKFNNDELGITTVINNTEIAKLCNLTVATVVTARKSLEKTGLIKVKNIDKFKHQVIIVGYENLHLTKDEGGSGYVKIGFNMFKELCKLTANELRIAFDLILSIDSNKGNKFNGTDSLTRNYSFIKKYLPSYVDCKKKVKEILKKLDGLFDLTFKEDNIQAKEIQTYNVENYLACVSKGNRKFIKKILKNTNINFDRKDLSDLVQMSIEYGCKSISNALMYIFLNTISIKETLGGLVRTLIKSASFNGLNTLNVN
ncbi:hypothetical protein [Clostridium ihumii]|uniref:hypothetical protein n=1 Tax=Clostridium ihumii TaxID=1470356 RepID=UPI00058F322A|nr:hypothetical protein [Clostridium ihumii]